MLTWGLLLMVVGDVPLNSVHRLWWEQRPGQRHVPLPAAV